jgi:hypothetical protein
MMWGMKKQQEKELEPRINTNGHELKNKDQFLWFFRDLSEKVEQQRSSGILGLSRTQNGKEAAAAYQRAYDPPGRMERVSFRCGGTIRGRGEGCSGRGMD